jgi:hypothetical protein
LSSLFLPGDIFGILALILISFTAVFMLFRRTLLKLTKKLDILRKIHIYAGTLGGFFLVLHVAYFISYPLSDAIVLGYIAAAAAAVVWITGTAFLERFKDTLFYHGSISLAAISLMVIHAASSGSNIPSELAYAALGITSIVVLVKALGHAKKVAKEIIPAKKMGSERPINPK